MQYWAERVGLKPDLVFRQMMAESSGNPAAVSSAGAMGLLQLMPATARELHCSDPLNPDMNLRAGTEYLARMKANAALVLNGVKVTEDDLDRLALASFNAGWGYVRLAMKDVISGMLPMTWQNVEKAMPHAKINGKSALMKQVSGYVAKILPSEPMLPLDEYVEKISRPSSTDHT